MEPARETHQQQMEKQIKLWDTQLGALKARAAKVAADARIELQEQVGELQALEKSARKHFDDFVSISGGKWRGSTAVLEESWTRLATAVDTAWRRAKE
jgi:sigma54-dependent transcription regulator